MRVRTDVPRGAAETGALQPFRSLEKQDALADAKKKLAMVQADRGPEDAIRREDGDLREAWLNKITGKKVF